MQHFRFSFLIAILCLSLAFYWGGTVGVFIAAILGVLEVSLSFDNAVVNASVLKGMDARWQRYFLTWGMIIAVFGMRLLFPIVIVAVATGIDFIAVSQMAINDTATYSQHLNNAHVQISAFGGMFLLMVFFSFIFNENKDLHWLGWIEKKIASFGKLEAIEIIIALSLLLISQNYLPAEDRLNALIAGVGGVVLFVIVSSCAALFEDKEVGEGVVIAAKKAGMMSFIYLEVLDASFSFDGVIGAFAITQDVVIIMLGLAIGAMFVRSITIYLVRKGTLDEYVFLEHGAHYAIGALAGIMLVSMRYHISEVVTGLVGAVLIALSVFSSVRYRKQHA
ncbi:MAG: DUF475 domain-containing protein [Methylococcaceae bacterium]|nr:DUF475 domain-containing protein [Methylococcaceae bacterium]MDZ4154951.1 DUF475 domain-containing protein [Methylococcales bacterium]MDP2392422.1 DUF475 domain-containing protein [Methylococcaceae bacterium]MDP3019528.1 DUF475 domain-containing protein [Methylococcaceae bacterium]MDP3389244.1 DUF475 domain-containing protein [Methylococcaceae bacterium]